MSACRSCSAPLEAEAVVCPHCHAFVHAEELERLKAQAIALEAEGRFGASRDAWRQALRLLPPNTNQTAWVIAHLEKLRDLPDTTASADASPAPAWLRRVGPLAPIAVLLFKGKGLLALFNMKSLVSLGAFMWFYGHQFGVAFGVGFAVLILVHEMGHFIDIRRRGLPADMPVFLPGLGAYVRWRALGVSDVTRAAVSLAGPLAGAIAALVCAVVWWTTGSAFWAALARSGAWLNAINLVPVWALDGGQAAAVLDRWERVALLSTALTLWLLLGESVFVLVAGGAIWRLFTKDLPARPSRLITAYFVAVLTALGVIMRLMPGVGAGVP